MGLGTIPTPPVSQSPVYVASAIAGLRIESSSFRPRPRVVPPPVSSHIEDSRATAVNGARHRTRSSSSQNRDRSRGRLDNEYIPRGEGFVRVASNLEHRPTLHRRKRIPLPSRLGDSSSPESECSAGHSPASSSRLRVDFRDMSLESSETLPDRNTSIKRRCALEKEPHRKSHSRRSEHRSSRKGYQEHILQVIKTLKSWGIRYSGKKKDLPEQFLSKLTACKRATAMPDEDFLPCLASVLVKEAGDWYEVYQEEIRTWNF